MDYYEKLVKNLQGSAIYMAIVTKSYLKDSKCATELGLAVLLDKPIMLIVKEGTHLPNNIKKLAQKIEYYKGPDDIGLIAKKLLLDKNVKER